MRTAPRQARHGLVSLLLLWQCQYLIFRASLHVSAARESRLLLGEERPHAGAEVLGIETGVAIGLLLGAQGARVRKAPDEPLVPARDQGRPVRDAAPAANALPPAPRSTMQRSDSSASSSRMRAPSRIHIALSSAFMRS